MRATGFPLICAAVLFGSPIAAQERVFDEFNAPELDRKIWCPCQIDMERAPVLFLPDPDEPNDRISRITVDPPTLGGNNCNKKSPEYECGKPKLTIAASDDVAFGTTEQPDTPEVLGPSFVDKQNMFAATAIVPSNPYCTAEEHECIQRQELRLQEQVHQQADRPLLYSFRFRMPDPVTDSTHSIRWVTAQWKQEPVSEDYTKRFGDDWGPSPFLAQRFDNGVLHVTVQDEHCRCMVASAPDGSNPQWEPGVPQDCQSTLPGVRPKTKCTPDLRVEYGSKPALSSPQKQWTEMSYRVEANRIRPAVIEVYQDGRFIVRVTGRIGYVPNPKDESEIKFKIGHYRDYMPSVDTMDIDWIKVEPLNP